MKVMITGAGAPGGPASIKGARDAGHVVTSVDIDSEAVGRHFANNFETIYIPGFGRTYDSGRFGMGFGYNISYLIPLYKKS